ncbi:MAG: hypothetical protein A3K10_05095 [Bacteroidetes bacterium RIFCSPLOWO2_12_FULL_31_6]|nr:MAG: hypothetical protein A3K10_05095 [Bacteroidetes bacterium RIFCSPLOWO2_12_FULL_31_6]
MKIIDLYIIRKFLSTFFFIISLLIIIAIVFDVSEKIDDFLRSEAPFKAIIFEYYLNFIIYYGNMFSFLIVFLAVTFFTSRMAADTEIVAMLSSGISFKRLMRPYMMAACILAFFSLLFNNFLVPLANEKRIGFENEYIRNPFKNSGKNIHRQMLADTYVSISRFDATTNEGRKFTLEKFKGSELKFILIADRIKWNEKDSTWSFFNFFIRKINGLDETISQGSKMDTIIKLSPKDFGQRLTNIETMNYFQLTSFIEQEKLSGAENIEFYLIELYQRFSYPFATFILTIIGVSIASRKIRGGIGLHLAIGILLCFVYLLFMKMFTVGSTNSGIPPIIAVWIPNLIFGVLSIYLLATAPK